MKTYVHRTTTAARLVLALGTVALGIIGTARTVSADMLFFGDADPPPGEFELTSGTLGGPNYYNNATKTCCSTPAAADILQLGNDATIVMALDESVTVAEIRVGPAPGSNPTDGSNAIIPYPKGGTLNINGGTVTTNPGPLSFSIGDGNTGVLNAGGDAVVTVGGRTSVGVAGGGATPGSTGTLTVGGTAIWNANGLAGVEVGGPVMSGHVTVSDTGQILIPNSWLFMGTGASTGNTFSQNGGTVSIGVTGAFNESLIIGHAAPSGASYALNGGTLIAAGTAQIGNFGSGSFKATGGTASFDEVNVSNFTDSTGLFEVVGNGATISVASRFTVGVGDDNLGGATGGLGTLRFETDALGDLSIIDVTSALGVAILGNATTIELDLAGSSPKPFYDLLTASSITADLNAITFTGPAGYALRISSGLRGEILQAVIPEPATAALALISVLAVLPLVRRR